MLALQLFLVTISVPLMLLATLIKERRDKEEALRESEERVTLAASAGKLGLWFWDVPRDEIWVGQGRCALFGWADDPVDFKRFMESVHPKDRERARAGVNWALQGGGDHVVEYRIVLSDGSIRRLVTRARVELDGAAARLGSAAFLLTSPERKLVDEALRESEADSRTMANTAPVMIWMSDPDKLCNFLNKGWLDFTGRSLEQASATVGRRESTPMTLIIALEYTLTLSMRDKSLRWNIACGDLTANIVGCWIMVCRALIRTVHFSGISVRPLTSPSAGERNLNCGGSARNWRM